MSRVSRKYPMQFINFLGDMRVTPKNMVIENQIDKGLEFVSRYFTPHPSVGELSRRVLETIHAKEVGINARKLPEGSLGGLVLGADLLKVHPNLEPYMRIIMLEAFSLEIAINHIPEFGEYLSEKDLKKVRENIKYSLEIISVDPRFVREHEALSELYIVLGYIEAQVPLIKKDLEGKVNG